MPAKGFENVDKVRWGFLEFLCLGHKVDKGLEWSNDLHRILRKGAWAAGLKCFIQLSRTFYGSPKSFPVFFIMQAEDITPSRSLFKKMANVLSKAG